MRLSTPTEVSKLVILGKVSSFYLLCGIKVVYVDNVCQMLEKKDELREKYGAELPVFVTGDFNSHPHRESIQNMKKVLPDSAEIAILGSTTGINSFHGVSGRPCPEGTPIDFIFVTDDAVKVLVHCIAADETALAISDHCPVYVDAKIN